ncbi:glutamate-5-semialdehyde dehydrogenase [Mucilaginibacter sp. UR6-1]|uniref:glutamate-5-semialdehyde dehydrogenase n=1 Tax=Mucilaginibacter sp. UR6-1 TaxID=1435643 RepID=UPI001E3E0749|nr:glutamate-5-semialdehyde dehydrogenase [Mucilaginibacter sp. UR6-1]MCC8407627.1 glutamate-5-semialdehyde dehydrogenase [Mucilaginibacter sp. UR6-1]
MSFNHYFDNAVAASRKMALLSNDTINDILTGVAAAAVAQTDYILAENKKDLDRMDKDDPKYDRLKLTAERIQGIANDIIAVTKLKSPLGNILDDRHLDNGLHISKISVPLGVVGVVYEARPNVTFDVFALCFKTGNVAVLKGGSDADHSNHCIISIIHRVLEKNNVDVNCATLLPADREATHALLNAVGKVDVLIPRGSQGLINYVRDNSKVPVIETGAGIVHTYIAPSADVAKAAAIVFNAKTRRVSVCNALDCLLIHSSQLNTLAAIIQPLADKQVIIYADEPAYAILNGNYPKELLQPATTEHFGAEFLDYKLAIKTVTDISEALAHIAKYSSKHSEAIITEDDADANRFTIAVDAAAVYVNASTAFTDGAQFGLGAEIGISTQKLHARGPMALNELTSYKWLVKGNGQIRNS